MRRRRNRTEAKDFCIFIVLTQPTAVLSHPSVRLKNGHPSVPTCRSAERRAQPLSRMALATAGGGAERPGQRRARC